jgi:peptidoglycan hydrolase-like protein with peptidoglycan-binding domain
VTPTPTTTPTTTPTPIPIPTTTPTSTPNPASTSTINIADLQALIQQLLAQVAQLQAQLALKQGIPTTFRFNNPIYLGLRNEEVRQLQIFLTGQGTSIYPEAKITGYYGYYTRLAVIRFQLKYNIISSQYSPGAGLVGIKTRAKINEILGR